MILLAQNSDVTVPPASGQDAAATAEALTDEDFRAHADFRYAMRRYFHFTEEQARAIGITPQQFTLLLAVRGHPAYPAVTIADIAERLQVRHHSASLLVDRSVKQDLLIRRQDVADRRRVLVRLSRKGEQALESITLANRRELRALQGALTSMRASLSRTRQAEASTDG